MPVTTDIFFLRGVPHCNMWGSSWKCGTPSHRLADVFLHQNWFFFQSDTPKKIWSAFISFLTQQTQPFQSIQPCSARAGEDFFSRCSLRPGWSCCKKPRKTSRPWACNFFAHPRKASPEIMHIMPIGESVGQVDKNAGSLIRKSNQLPRKMLLQKRKSCGFIWGTHKIGRNKPPDIYIYNYIYIYTFFNRVPNTSHFLHKTIGASPKELVADGLMAGKTPHGLLQILSSWRFLIFSMWPGRKPIAFRWLSWKTSSSRYATGRWKCVVEMSSIVIDDVILHGPSSFVLGLHIPIKKTKRLYILHLPYLNLNFGDQFLHHFWMI